MIIGGLGNMKVKIKDKIYDSNEQPIMVILNKEDKFNISHMSKRNSKYCSFPRFWNINEVKKFMKV